MALVAVSNVSPLATSTDPVLHARQDNPSQIHRFSIPSLVDFQQNHHTDPTSSINDRIRRDGGENITKGGGGAVTVSCAMESYSDAVINVGDKCLDEDENCRW
jgi:hypothetical protein